MPSSPSSAAQSNFEGLPFKVRQWISYEQTLLNRGRDEAILQPDRTNLPAFYWPEAKSIFRVPAFWVPLSAVHLFAASSLDPQLQRICVRQDRGRHEVICFLHPAAATGSLGAQLTALGAKASEAVFFGTPTASARTVLTWRDGCPEVPFQLKMSLPHRSAGARRTLTAAIIARSIGTTMILEGSSSSLPQDMRFVREMLGVAPGEPGRPCPGYIVREIPQSITADALGVVPFFSLYARLSGAGTLLEEMAERSGVGVRDFAEQVLCRGIVRQWLALVTDHGIIPEPHAQNLLLEVDDSLVPTGRYVHRDLEGFYVDLRFRQATGQFLPQHMPYVGSLAETYRQHPRKWRARIARSVQIYFRGTVVHNLNIMFKHKGSGRLRRGFQHVVMDELTAGLSARCGTRVKFREGEFDERLADAVLNLRAEIVRAKLAVA